MFGVQEAEQLARQDQLRLLRERKLALIVDLDQTLIHTAISPGIEGGLPVSIAYILCRQEPYYHSLSVYLLPPAKPC